MIVLVYVSGINYYTCIALKDSLLRLLCKETFFIKRNCVGQLLFDNVVNIEVVTDIVK